MQEWWNTLDTFQQVLYYIAIPATIILIIQTIMTVMGLEGDGDADVDIDLDLDLDTDVDADVDTDNDVAGVADYKFFTIRGFVAFFTIFGWVGIVLSDTIVPKLFVVIISLICGLLAMFIVAWLFSLVPKLQDNGNINIHNAIGKSGEVYIPIPSERSGRGKIQVIIQDRLLEVDAMTDEDKVLSTGTIVKVVGTINGTILLVKSRY